MAGLARRLAPAAALGGLALIVVGVADPALAGHTETTATGGSATLATGTQTTGTTAAGTQGSGTQDSGGSVEAAPAPQAPQAQSDTGQSTTTTQGAANCDNGQAVTGPSVDTRWGPVQVAGTVVDGKLCEAHAVVWPTGDGRSIAINNYAIPQLDAQAAHGAQLVDGVSGATYTSQGYYDSLQQLLDSL